MSGFTYEELVQSIKDFTDNEGEPLFEQNIDSFIRNSEERLLKEAQLQVFRKTATANMQAGNKYFPKPTDWLFSYHMLVVVDGVRKFLLTKDTSFLQDYAPDPTITGEPRYYSDFSVLSFLLAPTPAEAYPAELHYFYRPTSIVDADDGRTWLGTNAGPTLLYGALIEAYVFMKGEQDMIERYKQQYYESLGKVIEFARSAEGRDSLRTGTD